MGEVITFIIGWLIGIAVLFLFLFGKVSFDFAVVYFLFIVASNTTAMSFRQN